MGAGQAKCRRTQADRSQVGHQLPEPHQSPSASPGGSGPESWLKEWQMALRSIHQGAICRSLLSLTCKDFISFFSCHRRSSPPAPGPRTKVCREAPLSAGGLTEGSQRKQTTVGLGEGGDGNLHRLKWLWEDVFIRIYFIKSHKMVGSLLLKEKSLGSKRESERGNASSTRCI